MQTFPNYIKLERKQKFNILEELKEFKFKNKRIFQPNVIQIFDSLKTLKNSGFRVRAIVLDNHSANVLAYKLLRKEFYHLDDNLLIECDYQKIYLLHDAVHLIKNVRNNLLNYKKLLLKISSFQLPSQFLVNLHQQLLLVIFLRKKMMQNF